MMRPMRTLILGSVFLIVSLAAGPAGFIPSRRYPPVRTAPGSVPGILDKSTVSVFYGISGMPKKEGIQVCDSYDIPVDWVIVSFPYLVQGSLYLLTQKIDEVHRRGKIAVVYANAGDVGTGVPGALGEIRPDLLASVVVDIDGNRIHNPAGESTNYVGDLNEPGWRNFLRAEILTAIEAGADGVCIDAIGAQAPTVGAGGVFNEPDMQGFREFLRQIYSPAQLQTKFGIDDLNAFDYGDYIRGRNLAATWKSRPWEVPLYWQFYVYEARSVMQVYENLLTEARHVARSRFGREIILTGNTSPGFGINYWFERLLDFAWVEYPYHDPGYPPFGKTIPSFKLKVGDGWKKGTYINMVTCAYDLMQRGNPSEIAKIWIAEAYAAQSEYGVPYDIPALPSGFYSPDLDAVGPYYRFIRDRAEYFGKGWAWPSRVAILYPLSSNIGSAGYLGTALALFDAGVQFDVLFSGDGWILEDRLTPSKLAAYPVLLLPGTNALTARQVQLVLDYVRAGGTVVGWGYPGFSDEFNDWTAFGSRPAEWRDLTHVGTHSLGSGRFIVVSRSDLGDAYFRDRSPAARNLIIDPLRGMIDAETTSTAGENVNFLAAADASKSRLAVHMLNYRYDIGNDSFEPVGSFTLSLRLPEGFAMSGKTLRLISPDFPEVKTPAFSLRDGVIDVSIPGLLAYNLLVIE